jgi:hypothetical protein
VAVTLNRDYPRTLKGRLLRLEEALDIIESPGTTSRQAVERQAKVKRYLRVARAEVAGLRRDLGERGLLR